MPSLVYDLLPMLLKRRKYDDLLDYDKGWIDGTVNVFVEGGIMAIVLFGVFKFNRSVDNTPFDHMRLANAIILPGKRITL